MERASYGHAILLHEHQQVETEMLHYEHEYQLQNSHGNMVTQQVQQLEQRIARDEAHIAAWNRYREEVEEAWNTWYEGLAVEGLAAGSKAMLNRPCVDCGLYTGRHCDHCLARYRIPSEEWAHGQHTPLCSGCDNKWDSCRFCRGVFSCTPHPHGPRLVDNEG